MINNSKLPSSNNSNTFVVGEYVNYEGKPWQITKVHPNDDLELIDEDGNTEFVEEAHKTDPKEDSTNSNPLPDKKTRNQNEVDKRQERDKQLFKDGFWGKCNWDLRCLLDSGCADYLDHLISVSRKIYAWDTYEDWFFHTREQIYKEIFIPVTTQQRILEKLKNWGLVETAKKGFPAKLYYKINEGFLVQLLEKIRKDLASNLSTDQVLERNRLK